jgi:DNA processing protein
MEDIKEIKITDKHYPEAIKKLSDAPKVLYYKGVLPTSQENMVAVVGTRRPSSYGEQAAFQITGELADAGITVVSGMAPGIDTFAHRACVERSKKTIAVLGTGLDEKSIYPQENLELARQIIKNGGCLISEYKPGTPGFLGHFPQRNRIVVALSLGVVVIEAKEKSGSLITARLAMEQHKKLFAVPGPIYTLNAKGPNKLIKAGATLVESSQDVLDVLGIDNCPLTPLGELSIPNNEEEAAIFTALQVESLYIDAIIAKTKLPAPVVGSTLALMEISGKVRNLGGNTYSLNN